MCVLIDVVFFVVFVLAVALLLGVLRRAVSTVGRVVVVVGTRSLARLLLIVVVVVVLVVALGVLVVRRALVRLSDGRVTKLQTILFVDDLFAAGAFDVLRGQTGLFLNAEKCERRE